MYWINMTECSVFIFYRGFTCILNVCLSVGRSDNLSFYFLAVYNTKLKLKTKMKNKAENMKIKTDSKTIIVSQWDQTYISIKESHVQHHKFAYFIIVA